MRLFFENQKNLVVDSTNSGNNGHWSLNHSYKVLSTFFFLVALSFSCKDAEFIQHPNIIIIYADDLGFMDVGYNGNVHYDTPRIDNFSKQGMVFNNAYANAPFCSPSRASLITGLYTPAHQVYIPGSSERGPKEARKYVMPENKHYLDTSLVTIAEYLKSKNYITASIGKWHLGKGPTGPRAHGFDVNIAGNMIGKPASYFSPYYNPDITNGPSGEYLTDRLTIEAIDFINQNKDNPFFLYLSHFAPHTPIQAKKDLIGKYEKRFEGNQDLNPLYAAMVENLDFNVGMILDFLETSGLAENTLVIFSSDNGAYSLASSNLPLRGSKGNLYEGGIRVPLIIKWPSKIKPNTESDVPVAATDIFPTIVDILEQDENKSEKDGESITPLLFDAPRKFKERPLFWYEPVYLDSYNRKRYERDNILHLMRLTSYGEIEQKSEIESLPSDTYPAWRLTPAVAIRKGKWKLIRYLEYDSLELYNLEKDPYETNNLVVDLPLKTEELNNMIESWAKDIGAPLTFPRNPSYDSEFIFDYSKNESE
ncbi:sulfatase [Ulvibacterium sp.]|uniref:sulfatase n=1 Tax=Ulvibacterium sp. TaxID=2665914 RepID=UPI003BAD84EA